MQKKMLFILLMFLCFVSVSPVRAQDGQATIILTDRHSQPTTKIIDGDTVRLSIKLASPVDGDTEVSFFLDGVAETVATCELENGASTCSSDPFYALGWYWNADGTQHPERTIRAEVGGQSEALLTISVKARPVVMLHGFISNWETWQKYLGTDGYLASIGVQGFAVGDGQAPGLLNTGVIADPRKRTNTIAQNAEVLKTYIAGVQKQTGAEKVDLLVHSLGGMIARYYIDRIMDNNNVSQVIFLGTPMSGSSCVFPLAALGFMQPASLEIQPDYMMNIFNKQIIHRQGVGFHMLAGTFLTEPITSPCAATPSDTVVALSSASSIPLDDIKRIPLQHGDLTLDPGIFQDGVRKFLQSPPGTFGPRPDPLAPLTPPDDPGQFSRVYTGHIDPGQSTSVTIQIDANVQLANFNLYDSSRSLEIAIRGANGNIIQLDPLKNGMLKLDDPRAMTYLGYGFAQPNPGAWVVELKATAQTPASGADYAVNARYLGGIKLEASADHTLVERGQLVTFSASLKGATTTSGLIIIRKPDGATERFPLTADGEKFITSYEPTQSGLYSVELSVTGKSADGDAIERATNLTFETQSLTAQMKKKSSQWVTAIAIGLLVIALIIVIALKQYIKKR